MCVVSYECNLDIQYYIRHIVVTSQLCLFAVVSSSHIEGVCKIRYSHCIYVDKLVEKLEFNDSKNAMWSNQVKSNKNFRST